MSTPAAALDQGFDQLTGNYPCVYDGTRGHLLVGASIVSFVGFVFFFEKRLDINWSDVLHVVKNQQVGSVSFVLRDGGAVYEFTDIQQCERVWAALVSVHNEFLHGKSLIEAAARMKSPRRVTLVRATSDPNLAAYPSNTQDELSGFEATYIPTSAVAAMDEAGLGRPDVALSSGRRPSLMITGFGPLIDEGEEKVAVDLEAAWKLLQAGGEETYEHTAIEVRTINDGGRMDTASSLTCQYALSTPFLLQRRMLPCDLDVFFDKFIADSAPHSFEAFMVSTGERDLHVSPWELDEDTGVYTRIIHYTHPINAPLAPPIAKARKEQRYRRYGDHGLSVEMDTYVEDVPKTDCFYVTDRILVEPNQDGAVEVLAEFDIRFVKSTFFRSIIANTTQAEFKKWYRDLEIYWSRVIAAPPEVIEEEERIAARRRSTLLEAIEMVQLPEVKAPELGVVTSTHAMMLLLGMIFFMQTWMVFEMRGIKQTMLVMQEGMAGTCPEINYESD